MAKQGGLGSRFLTGGYDISGDVQALDNVTASTGLLDVTDITQSAHSRIGGLRDGSMGFTVFFDAANAHPVLSALPTADQVMMALLPPLSAPGSAAACLNAKQIGYDPTRGTDGSLTLKVAGQGNAYGLEWGTQLTSGVVTETASSGTLASVDFGTGTLDFGGQAYLQVTAFTGTDISIGVNTSSDNSSFSGIAALEQQVTAAPFASRVATGLTAAVKRYNQVYWYTTGGFTSATFALVFNRNPVATGF